MEPCTAILVGEPGLKCGVCTVATRSLRSGYFLLDPIALELEILGLVIGTLIVLLL